MVTSDAPRSPESFRPPHWAESALRLLLAHDDAETISGDLIEEYRDAVYPSRGRWRANVWLVLQVAGFAWRATWLWGALLAALLVGRSALDWFIPPADFSTRSFISTWAAISVFVAAGFWAAYRTRSLRAGALAGLVTGAIAFGFSAGGHLLLLAAWHDPQTMSAIEHSGGLGEVFVLPGLVIVAGTFLAALGGLVGKGVRLVRAS